LLDEDATGSDSLDFLRIRIGKGSPCYPIAGIVLGAWHLPDLQDR